jgi:hypothetical protein
VTATRAVIDYALRERGYECETRDRLYIFKKVEDPDDVTRSIEECFGEGRRVYAITADQLINLSFKDLLDKLDRVDW